MNQLSLFDSSENQKHQLQPYVHWTLYVDGASRNNPGPSGAGIYILKDDAVFEQNGFYLGTKTNNQAEYYALLLGLLKIKEYYGKNDHIQILSDSQLLVRQFKGEYKIRHPELKSIHLVAKSLLENMRYDITHILRDANAVADEMANIAIDKRKPIPSEFLEFFKKNALDF